MNELELKYEDMTFSQRQKEQQRIEKNILHLKADLIRMEKLLDRINSINYDISHHSKELYILEKQKQLAEKEAKVLCAA